MKSSDKIINQFLVAINEIFSGMDPRTFWPLNGGQIDSYFDVAEALDMYNRLTKLAKIKSTKEIAKILPAPDIIRQFLEHNAIIGLKVASKLKIGNINIEDRVKYVLLLFNILKEKVKNDIFCLDDKNILLSDNQVNKILSSEKWNLPKSDTEKKEIAYLIVAANNLIYTLYFDVFAAGGFYLHGPYSAAKNFGENTSMFIRDYSNLKPADIWPDFKFPYKKLNVCTVYKNLELRIDYTNHPTTFSSIGDKLAAYKILADDKELDIKEIIKISELCEKAAKNQSKFVNSLSSLDQVRKGALIEYFLFKEFRQESGDDWKPPKYLEKNIKKFDDKFIKQFAIQGEPPSLDHWQKLFDPRNNYLY